MVDYKRYETLKVEKKENVATVTLNRPDALNAINARSHYELEEIWADLDSDNEVKAVILTGAGRAFSAGGDMNWMQAMIKDPSTQIPGSRVKKLIQTLVSLRVPIIAALNGDCVGLGATIALHCDIILAVEKARIGDPHVKVGLVAGDGGVLIWPLHLSMCRAKELLMTGSLIKAPDAERIGLINKVVPAETLMEEAWKMAKGFVDGPTLAVNWTKMCLNKILQDRVNLLFDTTIAVELTSQNSADHAAAVQAFLNKQTPKFKGGPI